MQGYDLSGKRNTECTGRIHGSQTIKPHTNRSGTIKKAEKELTLSVFFYASIVMIDLLLDILLVLQFPNLFPELFFSGFAFICQEDFIAKNTDAADGNCYQQSRIGTGVMIYKRQKYSGNNNRRAYHYLSKEG